jgi:hypothetical protein
MSNLQSGGLKGKNTTFSTNRPCDEGSNHVRHIKKSRIFFPGLQKSTHNVPYNAGALVKYA